VALFRIDVSEQRIASIIRVERISALLTALTVQEPLGVTSQKKAFVVVAGVKT
jgi:hypothetical protein